MERPRLDDAPMHPLPEPYRVHWYQPGDEQHWLAIHLQAEHIVDVSPALYEEQFGVRRDLLPERQCFLLDAQDRPFATATAWFDDNYRGGRWGRVHWVAVTPDMQGRGLSKPLLSIILRRMIELEHDRVYLRTSTPRIPAINLYAQFGFLPALHTEEDREHWQRINRVLKRPFEL
jgi:GNAT superfamily N-acetyltransferase